MAPTAENSIGSQERKNNMLYQKLYAVLRQRMLDSAGFQYTDRSGWRDCPQTYISHCHPLWIIAYDQSTCRRIWITQIGSDIKIIIARTDENGNNKETFFHWSCKRKTELAAKLHQVLYGEENRA
ncbi:MAG: hypothetical protein PHY23_00395 [Oscillospiraceae bacterium]|nr:hypothetical protein [Oscillospiraceae bacterium]